MFERESSIHPHVRNAAQKFSERGGRALLVGGGIRDIITGKAPKDFDIEVYNLEPDDVEEVASGFGNIKEVGKSFGILKVALGDGFDLDISLPRTDSKSGEGHRGFEVKIDPYMSISEAALRRDFTINSLAFDPLTEEVIDPHGGVKDIKDKVLRVTDKVRFADDPLRVMRALQFAGRFDLIVEQESFDLMSEMVTRKEFAELPKERLLEEWKKLLLKSERPSKGLSLGMELGMFHVLHPEFVALLNTPQDGKWHPEGDAWTHTLMAVDQAARIAKNEGLAENDAFTLLVATLCHDLGKPLTSEEQSDGSITARGHDEVGVTIAQKFLERLGVDNDTSEKVKKLVENHMWAHMNFGDVVRGREAGDGAFRKLSVKLFPATITELALLSKADALGTGHYGSLEELQFETAHPETEWLLGRASNLGITEKKAGDIIMGRDLIAAGHKPGKQFGVITVLANALRDEKGYSQEQLLSAINTSRSLEDIVSDFTLKLSN